MREQTPAGEVLNDIQPSSPIDPNGNTPELFKNVIRQRRSSDLIAEFPRRPGINQKTFAPGWAFAVHDAFKDALDIKFTTVTQNGSTINAWTQGSLFAFKVGDVIYSHPDIYSCSYNEFFEGAGTLYGITSVLALQVIDAIAVQPTVALLNEIGETVKIEENHGWVRFSFFYLMPGEKNSLQYFNCTQVEFVNLLKTGSFKDMESGEVINLLLFFNRGIGHDEDKN